MVLMNRDVVLLTVDSLGAAHTGFLGYDRETTPRIDALAEDGVAYANCIAQSSHTPQSMPSMLYSEYPFRLGPISELPRDCPTVATALKTAGFETAGFHSNPFLSRAYGFDRGFDAFDDSLPLATNRVTTFIHRVLNYLRTQPYVRADKLNKQALDWINDNDADRRFLWLHYMDPHGPYLPPERFQRQFRKDVVPDKAAKRLWRRMVDDPETITSDDRDTLIDLYDAEIRFLDENIGALLDALEDRFPDRERTIVVAADHGESFGENGVYGHPRRLYEPLVNVPLIVSDPGLKRGRRIDRPVENIDIAPSILSLAGMDPPSSFRGSPLPRTETSGSTDGAPSHNPPFDLSHCTFTETVGEGGESDDVFFAVRHSRYKLVVRYGPEMNVVDEALYDLQSPDGESRDVLAEHPEIGDELRTTLATHVATASTEMAESLDDDSDAVVADRLRDLGYR
jgi:arylsulfatase A-like enzyme